MITITEMKREQMHEFFRIFQYDPETFEDSSVNNIYAYNPETVDHYYDNNLQQSKQHYAIMLNDQVIGDIYLKHNLEQKNSCEMAIHLANDWFKGKGYGTQAERMILEYAFCALKMDVVYADTLIKNKRSQRVLRKAGFKEVHSDNGRIYYECRYDDWTAETSRKTGSEFI